jgi:hypothetical protein
LWTKAFRVPLDPDGCYDSNMCSTGRDQVDATRILSGLLPGRPAWQLTDDEVEGALVDTERADAALVARRAELVREAALRSMKDRTKALSTERWLQDRFRLSHRDAKARVDQAQLLAGQPAAHTALAAGTVTPEQAAVIATALDAVDLLDQVDPVEREEAAEFLVDQAAGLSPRDLATAAQHLVEELTRNPLGRHSGRRRAGRAGAGRRGGSGAASRGQHLGREAPPRPVGRLPWHHPPRRRAGADGVVQAGRQVPPG